MNKREIKLLNCLLTSQREYMNGSELAEQLAISEKTLRKIIKDFNDCFYHMAEIQSLQGKGYRLLIQDEQVFYEVLQKEQTLATSFEDVTRIEEEEDRKHYIFYQLFFQERSLVTNDLMEELYISQSSLSKLLTSIREKLATYRLSLEKYSGKLVVVGDERDQRRFMIDYFLSKQIEQFSLQHLTDLSLFSQLDVKELYDIVLEVSWEEQIYLSDYSLMNLLIHLALAIKRLKDGHRLEILRLDSNEAQKKAEAVSQKIIKQIRGRVGIALPPEEASYIALHLLGKGSSAVAQSLYPVDVDKIIEMALESLNKEFPDLLSLNDEILQKGLKEHFGPLLFRLENGIQLTNPLYDQLSRDYSELIMITKKTFQDLPLFKKYSVSDHEWSYIVLHLLAAMERKQKQPFVKVLVVCATGIGSAQVLKNRLESRFSNRMRIVDCISFHEMSQYPLEKIDLIISSIDLTGTFFPKPVIHVSVLLNENDIICLEEYLGSSKQSRDSTCANNRVVLHQAFEHCFSPKKFLIIQHQLKKEDVIKKMIACLASDNHLEFQEEMLRQIHLRDEMGTVAFSRYLAIPHPAKSLSHHEEIIVAICTEGIYWDDEHPDIKLLFLISPSKWKNQQIRHLSQPIAHFVQDEEAQRELLENPTLNYFKKILLR